jgi:hypothetical protein
MESTSPYHEYNPPEDSDSDDGDGATPSTGDKIVLGVSIGSAVVGACIAGPVGALVGLRLGGTMAVAGVEKFEDSDVSEKMKVQLEELR